MDAEKILKEKNCSLHASWYVRLVSNYIPLRDIAADWRINIRAWLAKGKLQRIAKAINNREAHSTWQLFKNFCGRYHDKWLAGQQEIDNKFLCDRKKCTACGLCERICPRDNIERLEGSPVWQHRCVECLGCLHICPAKAIEYGEITKGRKRYRHKAIAPADLLRKG